MAREFRQGDVLAGRYRLDRPLGRGGMGVVWAALHLKLQRPVAIKVLHPRVAADPDTRARFVREARVAGAFRHPAAVEVHDFGDADGTLFLVMELLEGSSLGTFCAAHQPTVDERVNMLRQVADGLAAAHAQALVHRDLKPDNVFVVDNDPDKVKIVDFGLAFFHERAASSVGRLTADDVVSGTPEFMAPEALQGLDLGPPVDVYAWGITAFMLMAGELPFQGAVGTVMAAHLYSVPPRVSQRGAKIHVGFEDLIERTLAKNPAERPTAAQVVELIDLIKTHPEERSGLLVDRVRSGTASFGVPRGTIAGREARVLPPPGGASDTAGYEDAAPQLGLTVAVVGEADEQLTLALATSGLRATHHPVDAVWASLPAADAMLLMGDVDVVSMLKSRPAGPSGPPVLCAVAREAGADTAPLIRAGAADVVLLPLDVADVARKVVRAVRRARRRQVG